ncbi:MAG: toll/interleukin-1 receptor domain-containing protein [Pseudonocardiales bacterium]
MVTDDLDGIELFISHASEDKDELVRPLADYLRRVGVKVWYDEFTLTAGDSLSRSIDKGLARARYGLVVVSRNFILKRWPEYELRGLTAKEMAGADKVIIPIWHNISYEDILEFSPPLADKVAVVTSGLELPEIAEAVLRAIRPDLARRVSMLRALLRARGTGKVTNAPLDQVRRCLYRRSFRPKVMSSFAC